MGTPGAHAWPGGVIPEEIFDQVIQHLQLSDARNLRLVCREFHEKTSANFVHTLATWFKPEFLLVPDASNPLPGYGQSILNRLGHHTRRFSLCLEVDEDALSCPPIQPDQKLVPSYWGLHLWPNSDHVRYSDLAQLETAADDVKGVMRALRPLVNVVDMAISCDPGWGRLLGPERQHVAARVSRDRHRVMGLPTMHHRPPSRHMPLPVAPRSFWENATRRRRLTLKKMILNAGLTADDAESVRQHIEDMASYPGQESTLSLRESQPGLNPINLNASQKEFLMELEWASRALVQSWAVALADLCRKGDFRHLACLRFAKISSSHLTILTSERFWKGLSTVNEVHIQVLPDWRQVKKTHSTAVITDEPVEPVEAGPKTFHLLQLISQQRNITTFHFEWLCGGELSWGSQRGRYILPAPFTRRPELIVNRDTVNSPTDLLFFSHVVSLSLKNCWFTPHMFLYVMRRMARGSLVSLKLESVSLSGTARISPDPTQGYNPLRRVLEMYAASRSLPQPRPFPSVMDHGMPNNPPEPTLVGWAGPMFIPFQEAEVPNANVNTAPGPGLPNILGLAAPVVTDLVLLPPGGALAAEPTLGATPGPVPAGGARVVTISRCSWPGIIDALSSGPKTTRVPPPGSNESKVSDLRGPTISGMEFKSCGYVAVESPYVDTSRLGTWQFFANHYCWTTCELRASRGVAASYEPSFLEGSESTQVENEVMQSSWSELNGWVSPHLPRHETEVLRDVFGMHMGWDGVYDAQTAALAKAVNPTEPGQGRFSGVVSGKKL